MKGGHETCRSRTMRSLAIASVRGGTSSALFPFEAIERLQMAQDSYHLPVLVSEIVELFAALPAGVVIDATLGGGGHAGAILRSAPQIRIVGIDRDPEARTYAKHFLEPFGDRVLIVDSTFAEIATVVTDQRHFIGRQPIVGVLMDLGVSSHQLDEAGRGFSFRSEAPLDMRMDPTTGQTAAQLLSRMDRHELTRILRENGENRFAGSIAKSVIERQPQTTGELTQAVERAVPMAARRRGHVATRVFQALRILVNAEQEQLVDGLDAAIEVVAPEGVVAVISYHSGEDRVVKSVFHEASTGGCHCPADLGCVCGAVPTVSVFKASAQLAGTSEIELNPRSRSARLRIARKLAQ